MTQNYEQPLLIAGFAGDAGGINSRKPNTIYIVSDQQLKDVTLHAGFRRPDGDIFLGNLEVQLHVEGDAMLAVVGVKKPNFHSDVYELRVALLYLRMPEEKLGPGTYLTSVTIRDGYGRASNTVFATVVLDRAVRAYALDSEEFMTGITLADQLRPVSWRAG